MKSANFWNFWTVLPLHNSNNFACFQVGVGLRWTGWEHTTLTAIQLLSCSAFVRWEFLISWCLNYWVSCKNNNRVYQENCLFFKFSKNINLWLGTRIFILSQKKSIIQFRQNLSLEGNFFNWDGKVNKIWHLLFQRICSTYLEISIWPNWAENRNAVTPFSSTESMFISLGSIILFTPSNSPLHAAANSFPLLNFSSPIAVKCQRLRTKKK